MFIYKYFFFWSIASKSLLSYLTQTYWSLFFALTGFPSVPLAQTEFEKQAFRYAASMIFKMTWNFRPWCQWIFL